MLGKRRFLEAGLTALAVALVASTVSAAEFDDVPEWARVAVNRVVEAGVLKGVDGKFMGQKLVNRHQMAVVVARMLDKIESRDPGTMKRMDSRDVANLEALTIEFADELALMNVKVSTLEDAFVELKNTVEAIKAGRTVEDHPHGPSTQFSGLLSIGVVSTDNGVGTSPLLTRYAGTLKRTFFTVPQASLALNLDLGQGIGAHVQYDYATDGPNAGVGAVQLNEAYITWDNGPGPLGLKLGIMALPFQSWEYNGPQRTLQYSITPSTLNGFWEAHRIVGVEAQRSVNQTADSWRWRAGVFTGNDMAGVIGGGAATGRVYGTMLPGSSDLPVSGSGTGVLDNNPGYYIDVESGTAKNFGWRLGYFDVGGDNTTILPVLPSNDWSGFQLGGWYRGTRWQAQAQAMIGQEDYGTGVANTDDLRDYYLSFRWDMSDDRSALLRYESWQVDNGAVGTNIFPAGDREGDTLTFAYNQRVTDTSLLQLEYLTPSEDVAVGSTDVNDNLIQARYKVWW